MKGEPDLRPALIYCRESRDEGGQHYDRIETQRDVLEAFCRRQGIANIVDIVMDDHCSGTGFQRLEGILERVRRKELHFLVFKDSSRLGRNLKESLHFVEQVAEYGGEILFESEDYHEEFFPLQAWFNERRAREDSVKIRRVLQHKMVSGTLLIKPHYGYRRSGTTMLPEEETAAVVQEIFALADRGLGSGEIAGVLNRRGIPTPSQSRGCAKAAEAWNSQHIRRILANDVYLGTMTHHKTSKKSYKSKRTIRHAPEEWIVLEDHHIPLISRELYERVNHRPVRRKQIGEHPFSGLLRCGRCGSSMVLRSRKGRADTYICGKYHREGPGACGTHCIRAEDLRRAATAFAVEMLESRSGGMESQCVSDAGNSWEERRREEVLRRLEQIRRRLDGAYEDLQSGLLGESSFLRLREKYEAEESALQKSAEALSCAERKEKPGRLTAVSQSDIIKYLKMNFLTREQLGMLFYSATVFDPGELTLQRAEELGAAERSLRAEIFRRGGVLFSAKVRLEHFWIAP